MPGSQSNSSECIGCGLLTRVNGFLMQPFTGNATLQNWLLLGAVVLIAAYLWSRVNRTVSDLL